MTGEFVCTECGKSYSVRDSLVRHRKIHDAKARHGCPTCGLQFLRRDLLSRHKKIHDAAESDDAQRGRLRSQRACDRCAQKRVKCDIADGFRQNYSNGAASGSANPTSSMEISCSRCTSDGVICTNDRASMRHSSHASSQSSTTLSCSAMSSSPRNLVLALASDPNTSSSAMSTLMTAGEEENAELQRNTFGLGKSTQDSEAQSATDFAKTTLPNSTFPMLNLEPSPSLPLNMSDVACMPAIEHASSSLEAIAPMDWLSGCLAPNGGQEAGWEWLMDESIASSYSRQATPTGGLSFSLSDNNFGFFQQGEDNQPGATRQSAKNATGAVRAAPTSSSTSVPSTSVHSSLAGSLGGISFLQDGSEHEALQQLMNMSHSQVPNSAATLPSHRQPASGEPLEMKQQQRTSSQESRQRCAEMVVQRVVKAGPDTTSELMTELSTVVNCFTDLAIPYSPSACQDGHADIFAHCCRLYFNYFNKLWPLQCKRHFGPKSTTPVVYLSTCIIGAMYGNDELALFGRSLHEELRSALLMTSIDLRVPNTPSQAGCLAWLLNQIAALYLGHRRSFYVAQQLGTCLQAQSRRMGLFNEEMWAHSPSTTSAKERNEHGSCSILNARRRLALGVFRVDIYTALLLSTCPTVPWQELRIRPLAQEYWVCDAIPESQPSFASLNYYSDLIQIAADHDDLLPALQPLDLEIVLMGLVEDSWRVGQDRYIFHRLVGDDFCVTSASSGLIPAAPTADPSISSSSSSQPKANEGSDVPGVTLDVSNRTLGASHRPRLNRLRRQWSECFLALKSWRNSFVAMLQSPYFKGDQSRVFSCQVLFHLIYLQLHAGVNELANFAHSKSDMGTIPPTIQRWLKSPDSLCAIEHAISLHHLVSEELLKDPKDRPGFNILTYIALHHAAIVIWVVLTKADTGSTGSVTPRSISIRTSHSARHKTALVQANKLVIMKDFQSLLSKFESQWLIATNFASVIASLV